MEKNIKPLNDGDKSKNTGTTSVSSPAPAQSLEVTCAQEKIFSIDSPSSFFHAMWKRGTVKSFWG